MYMEEIYIKSLQMIKKLNIRNEEEYNKLLHNYLLLNSESLKYISQTRSFRKIIKIAKEVAQTSFLMQFLMQRQRKVIKNEVKI